MQQDNESYIGTRIEPEIKEILEKVAHAQGVSVSGFLRSLVKRELAKLDYLPDENKKAFGMPLKKTEP